MWAELEIALRVQSYIRNRRLRSTGVAAGAGAAYCHRDPVSLSPARRPGLRTSQQCCGRACVLGSGCPEYCGARAAFLVARLAMSGVIHLQTEIPGPNSRALMARRA